MKQISIEESSDNFSPSKWNKGGEGYVYRSSSYQYSDSGNHFNAKNTTSKGIEQLDSLLLDLKNEREQTKNRDILDSMTKNATIYRSNVGYVPSTTQSVKVIETTKQIDDISSRINESNKLKYDFQTIAPSNISNLETIVHSDNTLHSESDFENIALSSNILPLPGTKVTTTVRTYTYEIPLKNHLESSHRNLLNESHLKSLNNQSINVPNKMIYKNNNYSTVNEEVVYPKTTNQTYEFNEQFNSLTYNKNIRPPHPVATDELESKNYYSNKYNLTNNVYKVSEPYIIGPTKNSKFFKEPTKPVKSTSNQNEPFITNNTILEQDFGVENISKTHMTSKNYTTSTRVQPDVLVYQATPSPFPVDSTDYLSNNDSSKKFEQFEETLPKISRKKEIETSVATSHNQIIPTINKVGKEVYYPPKHEFLLSEGAKNSSGYSAEGRYAKGSGMYEYESGSRSKVKTKSGGALIPVCLPLCCAMPCSIM